MIGANKKRQITKAAFAALLGAGMSAFALSPAVAGGDIGGDCCADLEERVAELEATTARKGNRKVSLTVSGQVNKAVLYLSDGDDSDVFVVDNINSSSRFRFTGSAKIRDGWSAGYKVEIEFDSAESHLVSLVDANSNDNDDGNGTNGALDLRHAYWWIKSDDYGTISVGQRGHATYLITWMDTSGTLVAATSQKALIGGSMRWRTTAGTQTATTLSSVVNNYHEARGDVVRYDSPTYRGFKLSAAWGEDDVSDVALRFARKVKDFNVLAGIGYSKNEDETNDFEQVSGSFSLFHIPSGLNVSFAGGDRDTSGSSLDQTFYYVKAGLKRKYRSQGATAISFDYYHQDEHATATGEFEQWGVQVVQFIDAAAMELFASYSNSSYDTSSADYQDIDMVMAGARIKF